MSILNDKERINDELTVTTRRFPIATSASTRLNDARDDEQSTSSEITASSTSGCSSLIPSRSSYASMPIGSISLLTDKYEQIRKDLTARKTRDVGSETDTSMNTSCEKRGLLSIDSSASKLNLSRFSTGSSVSLRERNSPFYEGKTIFGGASAKRTRLSSSPYSRLNLSNVNVTRLKVNQTKKCPNNDNLSDAAKRILASIERVSTPIEDAKRIPIYGQPINTSKYLLEPRPAFQRRTSLNSTTNPGQVVQSVLPSSDKTKLKFSINSSLSIRDHVDGENVPNHAGSLVNSQQCVSSSSGVGGKMRTRLTKTHHSDIDKEESQLPLMHDLPSIQMPISSLPKFDLAKFTSNSSQSKSVSIAKPVTTTIEPVLMDDDSLSFSMPISERRPVGKRARFSPTKVTSSGSGSIITNKNVIISQSNEKVTSLASKDPAKANQTLHSLNLKVGMKRKAYHLDDEDSFVDEVRDVKKIVESKPEKHEVKKPEPAVLKVESKGDVIKSETLKPWPNLKMPKNVWTCSTCLINTNPADKNVCVACETPRESSKAASSVPVPEKLKSSWSAALIKPKNVWTCSTCLINTNPTEKDACVACETPRYGISDSKSTEKKPEPSTNSVFANIAKQISGSSTTMAPPTFKFGDPKISSTFSTSSVESSIFGKNSPTEDNDLQPKKTLEGFLSDMKKSDNNKTKAPDVSLTSFSSSTSSTSFKSSDLGKNDVNATKTSDSMPISSTKETTADKPLETIKEASTSSMLFGKPTLAPQKELFTFGAPKTSLNESTSSFTTTAVANISALPVSANSLTSISTKSPLDTGKLSPDSDKIKSFNFDSGTAVSTSMDSKSALKITTLTSSVGVEPPKFTFGSSSSAATTVASMALSNNIFGAVAKTTENTVDVPKLGFAFGSSSPSTVNTPSSSTLAKTSPKTVNFTFGSSAIAPTTIVSSGLTTASSALSQSTNPTPTFGVFGATSADKSNATASTIGGSGGFNFGAALKSNDPTPVSNALTSSTKKEMKFVSTTSNEIKSEAAQTPVFAFGNKASTTSSTSLFSSSNTVSTSAFKPNEAFEGINAFGSAPSMLTPQSTNLFKTTTATPTATTASTGVFAFGGSSTFGSVTTPATSSLTSSTLSTGLTFGAATSKPAPTFTFGAKPDATEPPKSASFAFGNVKTTQASNTLSTNNVLQGLSSATPPPPPSTFTFGASAASAAPSPAPSTGFSFGQPVVPPAPASSAPFVFGPSSTTGMSNDPFKPSTNSNPFGGSQTTTTAPAFAFGQTAAPPTAAQPSPFSFGAATNNNNMQQPVVPAPSPIPPINFSATPSFNFTGQSQNDANAPFKFTASSTTATGVPPGRTFKKAKRRFPPGQS